MKKLLLVLVLAGTAFGQKFTAPVIPPTTVVGSLPTASSWTYGIMWVSDGASATDCTTGSGSTKVLCKSDGSAWAALSSAGGGTGDTVGPSSATDNALSRFDSTTGKLIQNSNATLDDTGNLTLAASIALTEIAAPSGVASKSVMYTKSDHKLYTKLNNGSEDQVCTAATGGCSGTGTPGGSPTQCQYNGGGSFAGNAGCTTDGTKYTLTNPSTNGQVTNAQGTITTSTPARLHTATWNNASEIFIDDFTDITDTNSMYGSKFIEKKISGADRFTVSRDGEVEASNSFRAPHFYISASGSFVASTPDSDYAQMQFPSAGAWIFTDAATTGFDKIALGCATTSCPAIVRSGTGIKFQLGDKSADTYIQAKAFVAGGGTPSVGTCGTIGTGSKNAAGFITSGTTGGCTSVITFSGYTAATGWSCAISNGTTANLIRQTGSSTTTATFDGTTVSGDVLRYACTPY